MTSLPNLAALTLSTEVPPRRLAYSREKAEQAVQLRALRRIVARYTQADRRERWLLQEVLQQIRDLFMRQQEWTTNTGAPRDLALSELILTELRELYRVAFDDERRRAREVAEPDLEAARRMPNGTWDEQAARQRALSLAQLSFSWSENTLTQAIRDLMALFNTGKNTDDALRYIGIAMGRVRRAWNAYTPPADAPAPAPTPPDRVAEGMRRALAPSSGDFPPPPSRSLLPGSVAPRQPTNVFELDEQDLPEAPVPAPRALSPAPAPVPAPPEFALPPLAQPSPRRSSSPPPRPQAQREPRPPPPPGFQPRPWNSVLSFEEWERSERNRLHARSIRDRKEAIKRQRVYDVDPANYGPDGLLAPGGTLPPTPASPVRADDDGDGESPPSPVYDIAKPDGPAEAPDGFD